MYENTKTDKLLADSMSFLHPAHQKELKETVKQIDIFVDELLKKMNKDFD